MRCSHSHSAEVRPYSDVMDELVAHADFAVLEPRQGSLFQMHLQKGLNPICTACAGVVVRYRLLAACPPVLGALFMRNLGTITDWSGTAVSLRSPSNASQKTNDVLWVEVQTAVAFSSTLRLGMWIALSSPRGPVLSASLVCGV